MLGKRLWTLALGAAVALTASAGPCSAQTSKADAAKSARGKAAASTKKDEPKKDEAEKGDRPQGPWNDPKAQLRMLKMMLGGGGRGGPGGGRGGFGGGGGGMAGLLMQSPGLQEEIKLTDDQKKKLGEVNATADKARRELFSQMGGRRGGQQGGNRNEQGGGQIDREAMGQAMAQIGQQTEAGFSKILDKAQKARLNQIELRIIGVTAVARPDVAQKINLSPPQVAQVQMIVEQMNAAGQEIRSQGMQQMRGMFGGPGGPGGFGGPGGPGGVPGGAGGRRGGNAGEDGDTPKGQPAAKGDTAKADNARGNRRGGNPGDDQGGDRPDPNSPEAQARRAEMTEAMTKMTEDSEKIEKEAEAKIAKVLTKGQRAKFNGLLGAEFDLAKITDRMNRPGGGRGGDRGNNRGGDTTASRNGGAPKGKTPANDGDR